MKRRSNEFDIARLMRRSDHIEKYISQTRTALAHSISYPLTTAFNMPHGVACSFTLSSLLRFNAGADDGRLQQLCAALDYADPDALADALERDFRSLGGSGIFWRHAVQKEIRTGKLHVVRVSDFALIRDLYVGWDRRRVLSIPARLFTDFLTTPPSNKPSRQAVPA